MSTTYQQTDTAATFNVGCSGQTAGATTVARQAAVGGSAGAGAPSGDPGNNVTRAVAIFDCITTPGLTSWAAGTWNVNLNFPSMDGGTTLTAIYICDYNGSSYTTVASKTSGLTHTAGATGTFNETVSQGSAHTPQSQSLSRPFIVLVFTNTDLHGASGFTITPDQTIVAPFDLPTNPSLPHPRRGERYGALLQL